MRCQKSHSPRLFLWKNIFVVTAGFLASFLGLSFNSNEASALFVPTLSASIDQTAASVNGNQVINSTNKTTEIPLNLTVNTNNKTGYTATLNSETDETALVNNDSTSGAKIIRFHQLVSFLAFPIILGVINLAHPRITLRSQLCLRQYKFFRPQRKPMEVNQTNSVLA